MDFEIKKCALNDISELRKLFLAQANFQFTYNKCHEYGWADEYLFTQNAKKIGYGAVWGKDNRADRDTIFEFFLLPPLVADAGEFFHEFLRKSQVTHIECQSNDALLTQMFFENAEEIEAEAILFEDHSVAEVAVPGVATPGVTFLRKNDAVSNTREMGGYVLEKEGKEVANGGFMLNYNFPYADVYMEVAEAYRRQGLGVYMVHSLKQEINAMGLVPAARCNIRNLASKKTLLRAGFRPCGHRLKGKVKKPHA